MNRIAEQMIQFFRRFELIETESAFRKEINNKHIILDEHDFEVYLSCLLKSSKGKENRDINRKIKQITSLNKREIPKNPKNSETAVTSLNLDQNESGSLKKIKSRSNLRAASSKKKSHSRDLKGLESKSGKKKKTKGLTEQETEDIMEGLMNRLFNNYSVSEANQLNSGIEKLFGNRMFQKLYRDTDVLKEAFEDSENDSVGGKYSVIRNRVLESRILENDEITIGNDYVESEVWHTVKNKNEDAERAEEIRELSPGRKSGMYTFFLLEIFGTHLVWIYKNMRFKNI